MTVKEIIKIQAMLLGREDVVSYVSGIDVNPSTSTLNAVDLMVRCVNLSVNELATTYIPMIKTHTVEGREILFSDVHERILEILSVTDKNGRKIGYTQSAKKLVADTNGVVMEYSFIPSNYDLVDEIFYKENVLPPRLLAYASAAEYCLVERAFDESVMWRNRYVEGLSELFNPKNFKTKERRWY